MMKRADRLIDIFRHRRAAKGASTRYPDGAAGSSIPRHNKRHQ